MSKLLYNDRPAIFGRDCARKIGISEAVVLQTLHFAVLEIEEQAEQERNRLHFQREFYRDGHWWFRGTYEQMAARQFNFTNAETLRKILRRLEEQNLVFTAPIPVSGGRVAGKFYRVNHVAVDALAQQKITPQKGDWPVQNGQAEGVQNGQAEGVQNGQAEGVQNGQARVSKMDRLNDLTACPKWTGTPSLYESENSIENQQQQNIRVQVGENAGLPEEKTVVVSLLSQSEKPYALALTVAQELVEKFGTEQCRKQLGWIAHREPPKTGTRAGQLRRSIEQDWPEPQAARQARRKAALEAKRVEAAQEASAERAVQEERQSDEDAALWAFEFTLTEPEKSAIRAEAFDRLPNLPTIRSRVREHLDTGRPLPVTVAPMWTAAHRAVLQEKLQTENETNRPTNEGTNENGTNENGQNDNRTADRAEPEPNARERLEGLRL